MLTAILHEGDVAAAREAVRETGLALGFPPSALRLAQAAAAEMCLWALAQGFPASGPANLTVAPLRRAGRAGISMVLQAPGAIAEKEFQDDSRTPGLGLAGARRLSDHWEVSVRSGKVIIHAIQWLPEPASPELARHYIQVIETAPETAWEFGRQAVSHGLGVAAMAALHAGAMQHVSPPASSRAGQCFEEALPAFEMVYRGFAEARASMNGIERLLERETERIAQSLHDDAAQTMAALSIGIDGLDCGQPACALQAQRLKAMAEEAAGLFRALSRELRSPVLEEEGLAPALAALCESFSSRGGIAVEFRDELGRRPDAPRERAVYRMVQASLANVVRHAGATHVVVRLFASDDAVLCAVRDNGRGLDPGQPQAGLGLLGMRERAAALGGTVELAPALPHGLEIRICLPDPVS